MQNMQMDKNKKQNKGVNPLIVGVAGAAVGAVAVSLADQKNRKQVEKMIVEGYKQGEKVLSADAKLMDTKMKKK